MNIAEKMVKMQKRIEILKEERSESQGALKALLKDLKTSFGCNSIDEALKLLQEKRKEYKKNLQKFENDFQDFEDLYNKNIQEVSV